LLYAYFLHSKKQIKLHQLTLVILQTIKSNR